MVAITTTTLITYPVAVTFRLAMNPGQGYFEHCDYECFYIIIYSLALNDYVNSSLNVIFYCVIVTQFRERLRTRVTQVKAFFGRMGA
jgi:hypothetical protein